MSAADTFPYPDDDPATIRRLGRSLSDAPGALTGAVTGVEGVRDTLSDRWDTPAGRLAVAEVDAVGGLGDDAARALADAREPLDDYARALDTARDAIDGLRTRYDDAESDYQAELAAIGTTGPLTGPVLTEQRQAALEARNGRISGLTSEYDEVIRTLETRARGAAGSLTDIGGRVSPAPHTLDPDLARAYALDALPFMAARDRTSIVRVGNEIVVNTGDGNDNVRVLRDPRTGELIVRVNGTTHRFSPQEAPNVVVRTNGGSDVIEVQAGMPLGFTLLSGDQNDLVAGADGHDIVRSGGGNDDVIGGRGNDVVDAGGGNDNVKEGLSAAAAAQLARKYRSGIVVDPRGGGGHDAIRGGMGSDWINGGDGNDRIEGDDGTGRRGDGADTIRAGSGNDTVEAGAGDDDVDGFTGNDRIDGGRGRDVVHAGEGNDRVDGGAGHDYVDGYRGNDSLSGGSGKDVVSGGAGDDTLAGGRGDDVIYTGDGRDAVTDRSGQNRVYHQAEDRLDVNQATRQAAVEVQVVAIPENVEVTGSPEFRARVLADLDTLASSPTGRQMLERIGQLDDLRIVELAEQNGKAIPPWLLDDATIAYNPRFRLDPDAAPVTVLYHEMAHSYDQLSGSSVGIDGGADVYIGPDHDQSPRIGDTNGNGRIDPGDAPVVPDVNGDGLLTTVDLDANGNGRIDLREVDRNRDGTVDQDDGWTPNLERQAAGLPVDHDENPNTPDIGADQVPGIDHPNALTENGLRNEMGDPRRNTY
jgi:Ca2+-binding RTX toxin-like protein